MDYRHHDVTSPQTFSHRQTAADAQNYRWEHPERSAADKKFVLRFSIEFDFWEESAKDYFIGGWREERIIQK